MCVVMIYSVLMFRYAIMNSVYYLRQVSMITGDNPLTACHVAKELKFTRKTTLILQPANEKGTRTLVCVITSSLSIYMVFRIGQQYFSYHITKAIWEQISETTENYEMLHLFLSLVFLKVAHVVFSLQQDVSCAVSGCSGDQQMCFLFVNANNKSIAEDRNNRLGDFFNAGIK